MKSIVNDTVTYFVGKYYTREVNGSSTVVKKYYTAGAKTIAMRTIEGSTNTLNWLLTDPLGSTSTTANEDGSWNSTIKYTAFGCPCAARRVLRNTRETSGVTPTKYRYTGQLLEVEVRLYYYITRFYDPVTMHFTQTNTIVPNATDSTSYDSYAYVLNNPVRLCDPSSHMGGTCGAMIDGVWGNCGQGVKSYKNHVSTSNVIQNVKTEENKVNRPKKVVQVFFQLLPVFGPYYYGQSVEETYSGFQGSGEMNWIDGKGASISKGGTILGLFNDILLGFRPTFFRMTTPYDQVVSVYYEVTYEGAPRIDAIRVLTVTDITITNDSNIQRGINYSIIISGESNQRSELRTSYGESESFTIAPIKLESVGITISVSAFTGCIGCCIKSKNSMNYSGFIKFDVKP